MGTRVPPWEIANEWLLHSTIADVFPEPDLSHLVCDAVRACVDPDLYDVSDLAPEDQPPQLVSMLAAVLAYACHQGLGSSRAIVRACQHRTDFIALTAAWTPRLQEIVAFVERNAERAQEDVSRVMAVCAHLGFPPSSPLGIDADPATWTTSWIELVRTVDASDDQRLGSGVLRAADPPWLADPEERLQHVLDAAAALAPPAPEPDPVPEAVPLPPLPPWRRFRPTRPARLDLVPLVRAHSRGTTELMPAVPDIAPTPEPPRRPEPPPPRPAERPAPPPPRPAERPAPPPPVYDEDEDSTRAVRAMPDDEPPPRRAAERPAPPPPVYDEDDDVDSTRAVRAIPDDDPPPVRAPPAAGSTGAGAAVEIIRRIRDPHGRVVLIEASVAAALCDGELSAVEKRRIEQLLRFLRIDEGERDRIVGVLRAGRFPTLPPAEEVPDYDARVTIFEHAAIMVLVDGRPNDQETAFLRQLAAHLELAPEDIKEALRSAAQSV